MNEDFSRALWDMGVELSRAQAKVAQLEAAQYRRPVVTTLDECVAALLALPDATRNEVLRVLCEDAKLPHYTGGRMVICREHECCYTGPTCPACDWQREAEKAADEINTLSEELERYEDAARDYEAGTSPSAPDRPLPSAPGMSAEVVNPAVVISAEAASAHHALTGE